MQGLAALHAIGIIHCNINPSCLFIENGHVIIADFGCAQLPLRDIVQTAWEEAQRQWSREVEPYQAPELLLEWSPHVASDWWGFGLVLCFMLTARVSSDFTEIAHP